jgi:hypothetical protein
VPDPQVAQQHWQCPFKQRAPLVGLQYCCPNASQLPPPVVDAAA